MIRSKTMNMKIRATRLTLALAAVGLAFVASAQPAGGPPRGPMSLSAFDQNGDGVVTRDEFDAARAERMGQRAAQGAPMRGAASAPAFGDFDRDADGQITPEEFHAVQQERRQGGPGMGGGRGMGPGMGWNMPAFSDFDLDGSGALTKEELNEARGERIRSRAQQGYQMRNLANAPSFEEIDQNADGLVSPEEFARAQAGHMMPGAQR
jgi:Ca2+-binding EF-hand superfamily protein